MQVAGRSRSAACGFYPDAKDEVSVIEGSAPQYSGASQEAPHLTLAGLPSRATREAILTGCAGRWNVHPELDLALLARLTAGFTAEEMNRLCCDAAQRAAWDGRDAPGMGDFAEALDAAVQAGARPLLLDADERRAAAYHAAGHAVVAWLTPGARRPEWVTILSPDPCRDVGWAAAEGRPDLVLAELDVLLAGPAAEELVCQAPSAHMERDRAEALRLAGLAVALQQTGDAQALVEAGLQVARALLAGARAQVDRCAEFLVDEEILPAEQMTRLLGEASGRRNGITAVKRWR